MRFKTRLVTERIPQLLRICQVIDRVSGTCVVHLCSGNQDSVRIVALGDASSAPSTYTTLRRCDWFESYRIESQNDNQIGLEIDMHNLIRAVRSASAADYVLLKLTKKNVPALTFEITTPLGPILQDVPVTVLSAVRLAEYQDMQHPQTLGLALPSLLKLHTHVDRMKALSQSLSIVVRLTSSKATLSLRALTDMVNVDSTFSDLAVAGYDFEDSELERHRTDEVVSEAIVDMKAFSRSLHGFQVTPDHAYCFIYSSCVLIHLELPHEVSIVYVIPRRAAPL